jgi:hypothetical protein
MRNTSEFRISAVRNLIEYSVIIAWWLACVAFLRGTEATSGWWAIVVVLGCWVKTAFFGSENLNQLYQAAQANLSHHRFLILMGINMTQMVMSFAFDFHVLYLLNPKSFAGVASEIAPSEALFDCFYLSTLNFSFFGYSDILPQTVAAKMVNLTEIVLAFVTVIFILSDFVSLKESIRSARG